MFGNVLACRHRLGDHQARWVAALCGVCTAVGAAAGQLPRALLVTDAAALAVLAVELAPAPATVVDVGRCPLRGLRPATVLAPDDRACEAGVAAALLAAWVKLSDAVGDRDVPGGPIGRLGAQRLERRLRPVARAAGRRAGVDLEVLDASLAASGAVERARPADLDAWTAPAATATAAVVAAVAAGLEDVGARIGRATLLADAVADLDDDRVHGRPNPILAGAVDRAGAVALVRSDAAAVAAALAERCGPGSTSAVLWGRCWSAGLERAMRGAAPARLHAARRRAPHRHPGVCQAAAAPIVVVGALAASTADEQWFALQEQQRRRQQQRPGDPGDSGCCVDGYGGCDCGCCCGSCDCGCCCGDACCCGDGCCDC